jgi:putative nucleotidyltransferase with HDIG domain
MTRDEALAILDDWVQEDNLRKHMIAAEAIMGSLAQKFGEDEGSWKLAGLLHDIDFEKTRDDPAKHGLIAAEFLSQNGLPKEVVQAVKAHNAEALGVERESRLDFALTCAETITGLVVAACLVLPDKRLASLKPSSVRKRMKKKDFARSVSREDIMLCERLGLELDEFIEISVRAMEGVAEELGLG